MNCAFDKEKLTGYYDGELEAAEKAEVERHIASCSECLRELGELKSAAILVKELPRLRAPRSIAEGVSREIQATGKVHSFAKMRRTILWASAAAAALFIGLNVMYFSSADKSARPPMAAAAPPPVAVAQRPQEELAKKESAPAGRRVTADRAADEKLRSEARKSVEEERELSARDNAVKKSAAEPAPVERAREKDKADGLVTKGAPADAKPAEPMAPPKPAAAPPPAAVPAPVAKPAAAAPAPEAAEKAAPKKDGESLARAESKRGTGVDPAAEAPATHLTLASTQAAKGRIQLDEALRKIGVAPSPPPAAPTAKNMKAPATRETDTAISLELTDAQIARLKQELNKPGSSILLAAAPGDPVLAEFKDGRMFGRKTESGAAVAGGAAAQGAKTKELGKADAKAEQTKDYKDAKEGKDSDAPTRGLAEGLADKSGVEPRRKVVLHLIEVPFVPDAQTLPDAIKK